MAVIDPSGREVSARACRDEAEARTYASTLRQHIGWLSEAKFREYYRIPGVGEPSGGAAASGAPRNDR